MDAHKYHPQSLAPLRTDALSRGAYASARSVLAAVLQHPMGGGIGSEPVPSAEHPMGGGIGSGPDASAEHPMGGGIGSEPSAEYPVGGGISSDVED